MSDRSEENYRSLQRSYYTVPNWPKIEFSSEFKEDILKAFQLFDRDGEGSVTVDDVRVAFRALGYDAGVNEFHSLRQQTKDTNGRVDFGEFLDLIKNRMLALDDDMEIAKSFELLDSDDKGYIDINDLREAAQELNLHEFYDEDFAAMLLGAQIENTAEELEKTYEERQKKTRIRKGLTYGLDQTTSEAIAAVAMNSVGPLSMHGLEGLQRARRLSSSGQPNPGSLTVNLEQFSKIMKMTRPPVEDIKLL